MEIRVEPQPKSSVKLSITITPEEMHEYFERAAKSLSAQVKVEGFRQGKVPRSILEKRVGKDHLAHQAIELAVSDSYYQAVTKHTLRPIGSPKTDVKDEHEHLEEKGLSFTAVVPVVPDVTLGDYKQIRVTPEQSKYADKHVDEAIEQLRKGRANSAQVTRAAKKGDKAEIDFVGTLGGTEFPGGKSENHPIVIGEGSFVPGFEEELVGLKTGQVKKFKVTFPKDYRATELAGKTAEFTVTMRQLQESTLPKLDDAFAAGFGAKSLADLRKRLGENLKAEKEADAKRGTEMAVVNKLVDQAKVEIPEALVDEEVGAMIAELRAQIEGQGLPYEEYLKQIKKTEDGLRTEQRGEAERRVKMSLVLNTVQEAEGITPSAADVKVEIDRQLAEATEEDAKQRIKTDEFKRYVTRVLGNRQAVDTLVKYATGAAKPKRSG